MAKSTATSLFAQPLKGKNPDYCALVQHPRKFREQRAFIDALWGEYAPFADTHFKTEIQASFLQRYWEMYLTVSLLDQGFGVSSADRGPDVHITKGNCSCWVEAIAATAGTGPDAVPEMNRNSTASRVPNDQIILRLTAALMEKLSRYQKYLAAKIVGPTDPFVIAVNGQGIPFWQIPSNMPRIVSAVLPFGDQFVTINKKTLKAVDCGFQFRPAIPKRSGSTVPTTAFQMPQFEGVSAVIYSTAHVWSMTLARGHLTYLIHNPLAKNPIPRGFIRVNTEYWVDDDKLNGVTTPSL